MPANTDVLLFARALAFAAEKHQDQRRKGHAAEPYINHCAEVADLIAQATGGAEITAVLGALLHDTIEDTPTSREELERCFGPGVARTVAECTDDKSLTKAQRKQRQIDTAPEKSPPARMVKIADKISNLRAIGSSPPAGWAIDRRRAYLDWSRAVVDGCRGVSPSLEALFDETARDLDALLAAEAQAAE